MLLEAIKTPLGQINYGTGKDVSDETIADAGKPPTLKWLGDSFVDMPTGLQGKPARQPSPGP